MYELKFSSSYKKDVKLCQKRKYDITLLMDVINILVSGSNLDEKYKDHSLSGDYEGFRECHIKPDWLLIYYVDLNTLRLYLVRTGTHSDLF